MVRHISYNTRAVSNVLAYLFSFMIASTIMTGAVHITTSIMDSKSTDVGALQAQSIVNQVADALVEATAALQSMPDANYSKTLDIPVDLAGKGYYIEVTNNAVYVNTTDGSVSKSCINYNNGSLKIGVGDRISSGSGKVKISYQKPSFVYKLDFGTGNSTDHSPVETGCYFVSDSSHIKEILRDPPWWTPGSHPTSPPYRIPIFINNTAPPGSSFEAKNLTNSTVKIVLTPENFDYSNANLAFTKPSKTEVNSDLHFIELCYKEVGVPPLPEPHELEYIVDHWNPKGSSVIYVNISELKRNTSKYIYLYYGGHHALHDFSNVSVFFDDFDYNMTLGWNKTFDAFGPDRVCQLVIDHDNNLYAVGWGTDLTAPGSEDDWWIRKFNPTGEEFMNWNLSFDSGTGTDSVPGEGDSADVDTDNNLYVVDSHRLIKFDSAGNLIWENNAYGGNAVTTYADGIDTHIYVAKQGGASPIRIYKYDLDGNIVDNEPGQDYWKEVSVGGFPQLVNTIVTDDEGNVYIGGLTSGGGFIARIEQDDKSIRWSRLYGGGSTAIVDIIILENTTGTYLYAGGYTNRDSYLLHINASDGDDIIWSKTYHSGSEPPNDFDQIHSVALDRDGYVYAFGRGIGLVRPGLSQSDWWIKKFCANGTEIPPDPVDPDMGWDKKIDGNNSIDGPRSAVVDHYGYLYAGGYGADLGYTEGTGEDWWIKKFTPVGKEILNYTGSFDTELWELSHPYEINEHIGESCVNLHVEEHIITNKTDPILTVPEDEDEMYIVDAKILLNSTSNGSMILLSQYDENFYYSYVVSAYRNLTSSRFKLAKTNQIDTIVEVQNESEPDLSPAPGHWLRMRAYVYLNNSTQAPAPYAFISSHLYDFDTFVPYVNYVEVLDNTTDPIITGVAPYVSGCIGLGCNISESKLDGSPSNISVDWIRVLKSAPGFQPTVTIGPIESIRYGWRNPDDVSSTSLGPLNPYYPGPELMDLNYGSSDCVLIIADLGAIDLGGIDLGGSEFHSEEKYTITVTKGDEDDDNDEMYVKFKSATQYFGTLTFSDTLPGEFEAKWITIEKREGKTTPLTIKFSTTADADIWTYYG